MTVVVCTSAESSQKSAQPNRRMSKINAVESILISDLFVSLSQSAHFETSKNTNNLPEPNNVFEPARRSVG